MQFVAIVAVMLAGVESEFVRTPMPLDVQKVTFEYILSKGERSAMNCISVEGKNPAKEVEKYLRSKKFTIAPASDCKTTEDPRQRIMHVKSGKPAETLQLFNFKAADDQFGVVEWDQRCGFDCAVGGELFLRKEKGIWRVTAEGAQWITQISPGLPKTLNRRSIAPNRSA